MTVTEALTLARAYLTAEGVQRQVTADGAREDDDAYLVPWKSAPGTEDLVELGAPTLTDRQLGAVYTP